MRACCTAGIPRNGPIDRAHFPQTTGVIIDPVFALITDFAPLGSLSDVLQELPVWSVAHTIEHSLDVTPVQVGGHW